MRLRKARSSLGEGMPLRCVKERFARALYFAGPTVRLKRPFGFGMRRSSARFFFVMIPGRITLHITC